MRTPALAPLALLATLLAGCDDPEVGDAVPYPADSAAAYCRSLASLYADRLVACNEVASGAAGAVRSEVEAVCSVVDASVAAGRLTYAPAAGAACITAVQHASCAEIVDEDGGSCTSPYAGTVANGGACTLWNDCASGWCNTSATCPGVCTAWLALGHGCLSEGECGPGLVCGGGGVCVAEPPPGGDGDDCSVWPCGAGLVCNPVALLCEPAGGAGDACASDADCGAGFGCAASETCQPFLAEGTACGGIDDVCVAGTSCDGARCGSWPRVGEACSLAGDACLASWCYGAACRAYRAEGAACSGAEECGPGVDCDGVCVRRVCP